MFSKSANFCATCIIYSCTQRRNERNITFTLHPFLCKKQNNKSYPRRAAAPPAAARRGRHLAAVASIIIMKSETLSAAPGPEHAFFQHFRFIHNCHRISQLICRLCENYRQFSRYRIEPKDRSFSLQFEMPISWDPPISLR